MKIAVTGGGGFLGKAIVKQLLNLNHEVIIISRGDYPEVIKWGAEQFRGDLAEPQTSLDAFEACDAVIHCAAKAGIWGDPDDFHRSNIVATENVIRAVISHDIPKLIYTSSPSVTFSGDDEVNAPQTLPYPQSFLADYPRTKAAAEQLVLDANSASLATTALRPHLIWGKGDPHLIVRLLKRHLEGKLKIVGRGDNVVDMTHVENAAHAHLLALDTLQIGSPISGKPYFISDDAPIKMWEWLNQLFSDLGLPPVRSSVPAPIAYAAGAVLETTWRTLDKDGEPPMTRFVARQLSTSHWYDMGPAKRDFGYTPLVSYDDVYSELIDWIKETLMP